MTLNSVIKVISMSDALFIIMLLLGSVTRNRFVKRVLTK